MPYVFGVDGALLSVPDHFGGEIRAALDATVAMAAGSFDLDLGASVVAAAALDLKEARTDP